MPPRRPLADRFWEKVQKTSGCWLWTAGCTAAGYGLIGTGNGKELAYAHRVSWQLTNGPLPPHANVCHTCDNPPCVNPSHLFIGDKAANTHDCLDKGRNPRCKRKLTPEIVRKIRIDRRNGRPIASIAKEHGAHVTTIADVIHGRHWTWVK